MVEYLENCARLAIHKVKKKTPFHPQYLFIHSYFFASIDEVFWGHTKEACFFRVWRFAAKKIIKKCGFFNPISRSPNLAGFDLTSVEGCRLMANGSDLPTEYLAKFFAYLAY